MNMLKITFMHVDTGEVYLQESNECGCFNRPSNCFQTNRSEEGNETESKDQEGKISTGL